MESRDEWGQPRDEEPGGEYPIAPIPPHERQWRHPSELAASTRYDLPPTGPLGRGLAIATGVVTVVLAVGLVRLLAPGGTSVASIGATSVPGLLPSVTSSMTGASLTTAPASTSTGAPDGSATTAPGTTPVAGPPSTLVTASGSSAITWNDGTWDDGRWVVTAAEGLVAGTTTDVATPDGSTRTADVIAVDEGSGLALLALAPADPDGGGVSDTLPAAPVVGILPSAGTSVSAVARDGTTVTATLVETEDGLVVEPTAPTELPHGSPITDESGSVVGLCGGSVDGRTKVLDLGIVADMVRSTGNGWIGISGELRVDGISVTNVVESSPAHLAGLQAGDIIRSVDGVPVTEIGNFGDVIRRHEPGAAVVISVERNGTMVEVAVTVGDRSQQPVASSPPSASSAPETSTAGTAAVTTATTATTAVENALGGSQPPAPPPTPPTTAP